MDEGKNALLSQVQRIKTNISNAYEAAKKRGAKLPTQQNSDTLSETI